MIGRGRIAATDDDFDRKSSAKPPRTIGRGRIAALVLAGVAVIVTGLVLAFWVTRDRRDALRAFTELVGAANAGDLAAVRSRCSPGWLDRNRLEQALGGGVRKIPRNIHKNFQVWQEGDSVLICPSNRVGSVYRMVRGGAAGWQFDGLTGTIEDDRRYRAVPDQSSRPGPETSR